MKAFFLSIIFIFCSGSLFFIGRGVDQIDIMSERYKRALDAGANAAAEYRAYNTREILENQGSGFGVGFEDSLNVEVDREAALKWFYRLFYRNLGAFTKEGQEKLKKYIPMKALILYDRLMIADAEDNWFAYTPDGEKKYHMQYKGKSYYFTLSEQIYDVSSGSWTKAGDIGLDPTTRKAMVTGFITSELEGFLQGEGMGWSGNRYEMVFSLEDGKDEKLSGINGINFLVLCEGIPLPSMNPFKQASFFAYSVGGSEIIR